MRRQALHQAITRLAPVLTGLALGCALAGPLAAQTAPPAAPALDEMPALRAGDTGPAADSNSASSPGSANYGRPRRPPDPRQTYSGRRKVPPHPLPQLVPAPAPSVQRAQRSSRAANPDPIQIQPAPTVAAVPQLPQKTRPRAEEDPFGPTGIGVGSLRLTPYIEGDVGYDSNPNRGASTSAKGSTILRTEAGVGLKSDWSRHSLTGELRAGYTDVLKDSSASRPDATGRLGLQIDVTRDTLLNFEMRGSIDTQRPGSTELTATTVKSRPIVATVGATGGVTQNFGRLSLGLRGTVDRTNYENATLTNGTSLNLSANNYTAYGATGRVAYQLNPAITPFVEVTADTRKRDQAIDTAGFARDSTGANIRVGSTFEVSRLVTGQASVGYLRRDYADQRLASLSAPTFDASLVWTATPLTTVTVKGATTAQETTVTGVSGAINRSLSVEVGHALLRNLKLTALGALGETDYQGISLHERTLTGTLRADYNLTRSVVVRGSFTHERLQSSAAGSDYTANVFLLGLKLQR